MLRKILPKKRKILVKGVSLFYTFAKLLEVQPHRRQLDTPVAYAWGLL